MEFVWTILAGFTTGLAARMLFPELPASGFFMTSAMGIIGAVTATYSGQFMGWYHAAQGLGLVASVAGAAGLLGICQLFGKRSEQYS